MVLDDEEAWHHYANDGAEALREIEGSLLVLETDPADASGINRLYRGLHTLKGNSGFMGLSRIETLAHVAEDLIGLVRDGGVPLTPAMVDLLLEVVDRLRELVEAAGSARRDAQEERVAGLVTRLRAALEAAPARGAAATVTHQPAVAPVAPAVAAAPVAAVAPPPAAPEPEAAPAAVEQVDPAEELGYLEVFLSLAEESLPEINATVARLRVEPGAASLRDRLAELCNDFAFAADRMGYQPLVEMLQRMAAEAGAGGTDVENIGALELQLYGWLADVEEGYRSLAGGAACSYQIARTYERACAGMAYGDLARLRTVIEAPGLLDRDEVTLLFRRLRAACHHYGFTQASMACLDHQDQISRSCETGERPSDDELARVAEFIGQLGETINAVNAGADLEDVEAPSATPAPDARVVDALEISDSLRPHLTVDSLEQIPRLLQRGWKLFEVYADLERDAALSERLPAWISGRDVACLSSTVVPSKAGKDCFAYLFLVGTPIPTEELCATFADWDPRGVLLAVHEVGTPRIDTTNDATDRADEVFELTDAVPAAAPLDPAVAAPAIAPAVAAAPPTRSEAVAADPSSSGGAEEREPAGRDAASRVEYLRIDARKVSLIMDLAGELGLASGAVMHHPELEGKELEGFSAAAHKLEMLIRELQNEVSAMRLVPVAGVFQRMRRVVRDVSRRTGKRVELTLVGEETEIDKVMVDSLADPLVHMLRNAVDHGIESTEEREAQGKPAAGRIVLEAAHQGGEVTVKVSDDGRGLDRERILRRARERDLIPEGKQLTDDEILELVFLPGFSTKEQIDELSGRGVGMDVIKTVIEGMRGRVRIRSTPGRGTSVSMTVPLTLAFIEAMVVRERDRLFAVPIEKVFEVFKAVPDRIAHSSADGRTSIRVRNSLVPVCWLHRYYGEPVGGEDGDGLGDRIVVVVQTSRGSLAIPVDQLLGNQQLMLKPLRGLLSGVRGAAGCGVLRTGDVALAIDCEQLHA